MCSNIVINGMSTHKYGVMNSYLSLQCQKGLYEIEPKRPLLLILKALFCLPSNFSPLLTLQQYIYILLLVGSPQYFERGAALLMR